MDWQLATHVRSFTCSHRKRIDFGGGLATHVRSFTRSHDDRRNSPPFHALRRASRGLRSFGPFSRWAITPLQAERQSHQAPPVCERSRGSSHHTTSRSHFSGNEAARRPSSLRHIADGQFPSARRRCRNRASVYWGRCLRFLAFLALPFLHSHPGDVEPDSLRLRLEPQSAKKTRPVKWHVLAGEQRFLA